MALRELCAWAGAVPRECGMILCGPQNEKCYFGEGKKMTSDSFIGACQWPRFLRWILFLPAILLAVCCIRFLLGLLAFFGQWGSFWTEIGTTAVEPWGLLMVGLWLLPQFHKVFIFVISGCYIAGYSWVAFYLPLQVHKAYNWHFVLVDLLAIVSCIFAAIYCYRAIDKAQDKFNL